jgi:4-hydroxyphenylpyruvate dioxygenase
MRISQQALGTDDPGDKTRRDRMGPFPHDAPRAEISADNPAGTNGFEFVEFAHPDPEELEALFARMGYSPVARHRTKAITVWRQGDINYILNAEKGSFADRFVETHGPCAPSMAWRVADARQALAHAVSKGAEEYTGDDKTLDVPAIVGIGGSLLYFVDTWGEKGSAYDAEFEWLGERDPKPEGVGFYYLDHLTHNVYRGNMDKWWDFYRDLFGFKQIHFFDIEGKLTGLVSRAITSPCGRSASRSTNPPTTRARSRNICANTMARASSTSPSAPMTSIRRHRLDCRKGREVHAGPAGNLLRSLRDRVHGHDEPIDRMKKHGILIDGEGVVDGGRPRSCCRYSPRP